MLFDSIYKTMCRELNSFGASKMSQFSHQLNKYVNFNGIVLSVLRFGATVTYLREYDGAWL